MSEYHIGRLIRGFRESKNITRQALYYGVKDIRHVSDMENGEQEMSKLLVDVLLERMGLSTDMYGYVFTIKEYEQFQMRADILEKLEQGNYSKAKRLCRYYEKMTENNDKMEKLEKQFIRAVRLLIAMEQGAEPEYMLKEAESILFLTVPKFEIRNINDYMLSGMERMLIAIQAEAYCRMSNQEKGMDLYYYNLLFHLERYCTDPWEQERQIPPLVMLMVRWLWRWERYSEMHICEKAIKILRNGMRLTLLEPLMEYEMKAWETGSVPVPEWESKEEWQAGLVALAEVREEYKVPRRHTEENMDTSLFILMIRQNYRGQILGDVVRRIRMEKGMTIEELSDGICEPEHLRKIELGTMKPREKTYSQLMKRLGQSEYAYHPVMCSDDYRMYECYLEVRKYLSRFEYEKAYYEFKKLERGLDLKYKINYQLILKFYGILKEKLEEIELNEKYEYLKQSIEVTIPRNVELEKWPLCEEELVLWNNIAGVLEKKGEREEAICVLKKIKRFYEQNEMKLWNYKTRYMMNICNLSSALGRGQNYNEAIKVIEKGIPLALEWEHGNYLGILLYNMIWIREKQEVNNKAIKKECLHGLEQTFFIASITQCVALKYAVKKYCGILKK